MHACDDCDSSGEARCRCLTHKSGAPAEPKIPRRAKDHIVDNQEDTPTGDTAAAFECQELIRLSVEDDLLAATPINPQNQRVPAGRDRNGNGPTCANGRDNDAVDPDLVSPQPVRVAL